MANFNYGLFLFHLLVLQSKSHGRSPNHNDRRGSSDRRGRRSPESDNRGSRERADRSSRERTDKSSRDRDDRSSRDRADRSSRERGDRRCSMERKDSSYGMVSSASDRSSSGPSEKQLYHSDKQEKGRFHPVCGVKKEPTRKVTADEAAAIVLAATRGLGAANDSLNTMKGAKDNVRTPISNDPSSFGSFSSLQDRDALSKHISNSEADASLTSSGQPQREGFGIIDDDWIANTIAKAAAAAASKEADSSEASMTKEQKLKAERLRRAKMFAAIIKSGDNKMNDLAAASDPISEAAKSIPDMNISGPDLQSVAKEREGSSAPFEHEGPNMTHKDSDDEQNKVRKYRKKHQESDEEKDESEDSYNHLRKRHHPEHSRGKSKDVHKHKHKSYSKDRESRHHRHRYDSSEDEQVHERRSSKSRQRHRDGHRYSDEEEHRRSHKHRRREHHSSSKRKHEEDLDHSEQPQGCLELEVSPSRSDAKFESDKLPDDTAQPTQGTTEVPSELRAKIRAMLLERL